MMILTSPRLLVFFPLYQNFWHSPIRKPALFATNLVAFSMSSMSSSSSQDVKRSDMRLMGIPEFFLNYITKSSYLNKVC